ncbi:hypothetical protein B0H14DRAFT_2594495 [Mycena olivaceomarginata]|nr:hypothetical protein B0H14DRAFT_2594495 [Mycena olivaceomarginata]
MLIHLNLFFVFLCLGVYFSLLVDGGGHALLFVLPRGFRVHHTRPHFFPSLVPMPWNANVSGRESEEQEKGDANDTQRKESRAGRLDGKGRTTDTERAVDIKDRDKEKEHAQAQGKRSSGVWEAREGANGAREPVGGDAPRGEKSTDIGEGKTGRDSEVPVVYLPSAVGVIQPWAGSSILPLHGPDIVKRTKPWAAFNPTPQGLLREVGTMYSILPAHRRSGEDSRPFLTLTPKKMNSEFD